MSEDLEAATIEKARNIFRGAAERMAGIGVPVDDMVIGMAYAVQDVLAKSLGDHHEAIAWLRTCADLQERQLLARAAARH